MLDRILRRQHHERRWQLMCHAFNRHLVACGCVFENRTLFEGIDVLPAASAWQFGRGGLDRKTTYFQPDEWERQAPGRVETDLPGPLGLPGRAPGET